MQVFEKYVNLRTVVSRLKWIFVGALLGAHSLGYTNITNSGYGFNPSNVALPFVLNAWDSTPHILDNKYFIELTQKVTLLCVIIWIVTVTSSSNACMLAFIELTELEKCTCRSSW